MNTIELRGTISNIRYIPTYIPTYHFIVNGQHCSYQGSLPLEMGDYVKIAGRPNDKPIFKHCTICQWDVGRTMQSLITDVETFN